MKEEGGSCESCHVRDVCIFREQDRERERERERERGIVRETERKINRWIYILKE